MYSNTFSGTNRGIKRGGETDKQSGFRSSYATILPRTDLVVHRNAMVVNTRKIFRCWSDEVAVSCISQGWLLHLHGETDRRTHIVIHRKQPCDLKMVVNTRNIFRRWSDWLLSALLGEADRPSGS